MLVGPILIKRGEGGRYAEKNRFLEIKLGMNTNDGVLKQKAQRDQRRGGAGDRPVIAKLGALLNKWVEENNPWLERKFAADIIELQRKSDTADRAMIFKATEQRVAWVGIKLMWHNFPNREAWF